MVTTGTIVTFVVIAVAALIIIIALAQTIKVVQQGYVGVVQRFGRYVAPVRPPGVTLILPFIDRLVRVDMRETPRTGDRQEVITADNVAARSTPPSSARSSTPRLALFGGSNYFAVAIDQPGAHHAATRLGNVSLDQALSAARAHQPEHAGADGAGHRQVGDPHQPDRDRRHHPAAADPPGDGPAEAGRPGEARPHPPAEGPADLGGEHRRRQPPGG